jgi:hypothetical protein
MKRPTYSTAYVLAMLGTGVYCGVIIGAWMTGQRRNQQAREDRLRERTEKLEREVFKDQVHDIAPMPVRIVNP